MSSHEVGCCPSAGSKLHVDLRVAETEYCPTLGGCSGIKGSISFLILWPLMPKASIGLNDQLSLLEHKVGLPAVKHGLVHLELQPTLLERSIEKALDRGHLDGPSAQSPLPHPLSCFRGMLTAKIGLAGFLYCFRRRFAAKVGLAHSLSRLGRESLAQLSLATLLSHRGGKLVAKCIFVAKHRLAYFRRSLVSPSWHFMFNYNIGG